jgi:hypothetical protein
MAGSPTPGGSFGGDLPPGFGGGAGFTFNPAPLVLSGQNVAGGLSFDLPLPLSSIDPQSAAYAYSQGVNTAAFGFINQAATQAYAQTVPFNTAVEGNLTQLGGGLSAALNTEANAAQTLAKGAALGGAGGFLGGAGGFLKSIFSLF